MVIGWIGGDCERLTTGQRATTAARYARDLTLTISMSCLASANSLRRQPWLTFTRRGRGDYQRGLTPAGCWSRNPAAGRPHSAREPQQPIIR